jgi:exo-1,4-beta-D-glucosaminidase
MTFAVTTAGPAGGRAAVRAWQVASSGEAGLDGSLISAPGCDAGSWLTAPPRSTVMAALLANGEYPDVFSSTTMRDAVDPARFAVPWWFRTLFTTAATGLTHVQVNGVIPRADLWVNGQLVADAARLAGAYAAGTFDVTGLVQPGTNALALLVHPGNPMEDLSIGWVDWSQYPPDHNMGPWRDVTVASTGDVRLGPPHVVTTLADGPDKARLQVTVEASNHARQPRTAVIAGTVTGHGTRLAFRREMTIGPGTSEPVQFGAGDDDLAVTDPALWWPIGEGAQPRYQLAVTVTVDDVLSDHAETAFGIRTVGSEIRPGGGRQFRVNGRPVQILGAGWSPDLFLRHDDHRLAAQLALTTHMGLNTIRLEGKQENPEFFDLCDQLGIMVLPGWECCNKWEAAAGTGGAAWSEHDAEVAERAMAAEAERLRNHPSVIGFLIGSDFAPPEEIAGRYVRALRQAGWDLPVVASATAQGSEATGPSGMKMTGPYDWVPPGYWYERDPALGGAVGFNSETSAGHTIPRLPSLRRMLSPAELDQLWQQPELAQYHSAPPSVFDNLRIYGQALAERYGRAQSAEDFAAKSQLAAYEAVRAQFEAFASRAGADQPATGVIYWMLNAPWPSLNWQLFDYDLDTPGSFYGARKALEPLHVLYCYGTRRVQVLNRTRAAVASLTVTVRSWRADGGLAGEDQHRVPSLREGEVADVAAVSDPAGMNGTWFLELDLAEESAQSPSGAVPRSRNVYWLSTTRDVIDRDSTTWPSTGVSQYADLRGLDQMHAARLQASVRAERAGTDVIAEVTVGNDDPAGTPAVGIHASVTRGGEPLAPVFWDDNDVTLFAGQSVTLTARLAAASGRGRLQVRIDGYNLYRSLVLPLDAEPAP